jgi:two-component system nitrate/nitrite response regulator NarL
MPDGPLRVVIADDHPVYRSGLVRIVSSHSGMEIVGEAVDGPSALEAIERLEPDVALVDLEMPGMDGIEVVRRLRASNARAAVVMLTASSEDVYVALESGAAGYVLKTAGAEVIQGALIAAAEGMTTIPSELQSNLAREIRARGAAPDTPQLSGRELEIVRLSADGQSAADVAAKLHLSVPTVRSHLQTAYRKLGVSDRAAAVAEAMRLGLID